MTVYYQEDDIIGWGKPSLMASAVLQGFICKESLKYLGFESLTGQAKYNQMTKLEQTGSQFGKVATALPVATVQLKTVQTVNDCHDTAMATTRDE